MTNQRQEPLRRRTARDMQTCLREGTQLAVAGWTRQQVIRHYVALGYRKDGISLARVLDAYDKQIARG